MYTLIADSHLPVKRIIKIARLLRLQHGILTVLKIFIVLQTREGGGGKLKIITDFVAAGGGVLMFTFTKISNVIFV